MALTRINNNSLSAVTAASNLVLASSQMPQGSTLQIVQQDYTGSSYRKAMTTGQWTDVIPISITPSATTSKILLMYTSGLNYQDNNLSFYCHVRIIRNFGISATAYFGDSNYGITAQYLHGSSFNDYGFPLSVQYLDSPGTTEQIEYKVQFKFSAGSGFAGHDTGRGIMTATEIAG